MDKEANNVAADLLTDAGFTEQAMILRHLEAIINEAARKAAEEVLNTPLPGATAIQSFELDPRFEDE